MNQQPNRWVTLGNGAVWLLNPFMFTMLLVGTFVLPTVWVSHLRPGLALILALPLLVYFVALLTVRMNSLMLRGLTVVAIPVALYRLMAVVGAQNGPQSHLTEFWFSSGVLFILMFGINRMTESLVPFLPKLNELPDMRQIRWQGLIPDIRGRWASLATWQHVVLGVLVVLSLCGAGAAVCIPLAVFLFFWWSRPREEEAVPAEPAAAPDDQPQPVPNDNPNPQPVIVVATAVPAYGDGQLLAWDTNADQNGTHEVIALPGPTAPALPDTGTTHPGLPPGGDDPNDRY